MNADESTSQLRNELLQSIESVKSALSLATTQKKSFQENALVSKNQIQDDVSFHLEFLRNREVWLLEQVDVHVQLKEETFESHLNELCVLLAKLEVYEQLLEAQELQDSQVIARQAKEIISRLSNVVSHFEEASGICFSADNFALSDAVKNYGNIVEGESARKTPRVYKKKSASRDRSHELAFIQEYFKQVARSPQKDWLVGGLEVKESRKDFGIVWKYFEELKRSDSEEWLYKKSQPMDVETVSNRFKEHFQQVKSAPATEWLQPGVATDDDDNSSGYPSYTTLDTSENIKAWLLRPLEGLSLSSKGEDLVDEGISLSRHCNVDGKGSEKYSSEKCIDGKNGWLLDEKLRDGSSQDSQGKPIGDQLPDDWLSGSSTSHPLQVTQTGSWLQRFRESTGTSTSDWLIESESEAEPEYCDWLTQESIDRCKSCSKECPKDTFSVFRNVLNSSKSEWLATVSDW